MPGVQDRTNIRGWGADLDPANRPAVPMERIPARLQVAWEKPPRQKRRMPVFVSVEYPERPPIFGTSAPPTGLSGVIRKAAFKLSENDIRHWLMLILADRINEFEGIIEDFERGTLPNIFAEMGWKAKFKYDRAAAIRKVLIMGLAVAGGVYLIIRKRED